MAAAASAFGPVDPGATDPRVLVIGLNRCGTHSIHQLFLDSGVPALHWRHPDDKRNLARAMLHNIGLGLPPLDGFAPARVFSDLSFLGANIGIEGARFFRELHAAYPQAYFILNTRPVDDWITSRLAHSRGDYARGWARLVGLDVPALAERWRALFLRHHAEVEAHFAGNPRFLRFDITADDPQALVDLVAPDFVLDRAAWGHLGRGHGTEMARKVLAGEV